MSRGKALALGAFTAWPVLYMILFMSGIFVSIVADLADAGPGGEFPYGLLIIFPLHLITMLDIVALQVIYVLYLIKTDAVPQDKRALWVAVIALGGMLSMPVFWYLYVWRRPDQGLPEPAGERTVEERAPGLDPAAEQDGTGQGHTVNVVRRVLWSLYAWPVTLEILVSSAFSTVELGLIAAVDVLLTVPSLVALHMHIWDRRTFPAAVWKIYAFTFLAWQLAYGFFLEPAAAGEPFDPLSLVTAFVTVPLFVALFRYAFRAWDEIPSAEEGRAGEALP
ncbi:MAG: hypothetical protein C4521_04795 [Actinobacteria bacterium]|nr:MAG: hypothetical protein C4521_04795 [Actinomycetota bacterium]